MKHVFSISFEILGSHAQITEMKFTRATYRTRVFLLAELPDVLNYVGHISQFEPGKIMETYVTAVDN